MFVSISSPQKQFITRRVITSMLFALLLGASGAWAQLTVQKVEAYDAFGNPTRVSDAAGRVTLYYYGSNSSPFTQAGSGAAAVNGVQGVYLTGIVQVVGSVDSPACSGDDLCTSAVYDAYGRLTELTSANQVSASYAYDAFHRLSEVRNNAGSLVSEYDYTYTGTSFSGSNPNWIQTQSYDGDGGARQARGYIDGLGREVQTVARRQSGSYVVSHTEYDEQGRPWKNWNPFTATSVGFKVGATVASATQSAYGSAIGYTERQYEASPLGRVKKVISPGGEASYGASQHSYGVEDGLVVSTTTDGEGKAVKTFSDGWGRTIYTVADPGGLSDTTGFVYNVKDELVEVRPPNYYEPPSGSSPGDWVISYSYDSRGNMIQKHSNDFGTVRYAYNGAGQLRFSQDANQAAAGRVAYVRYDELGRAVEQGVGAHAGAFSALNPELTQSFEGDTQDSDGNLLGVTAYDAKPSTSAYPWNLFATKINSFTATYAEGQVVGSMYRYGGGGGGAQNPENPEVYGVGYSSGENQTVRAANTLSSSNTQVDSGASVTFEAGSQIILKPGFKAEAGSDFVARIDPALYGTSGHGISSLTGSNPWQLTLQSYDAEGRLARKDIYTGNQRGWDATLTYTYNDLGELTRLGTEVAGQTLYQHYAYNELGQLTTVTLTTDGMADTEPHEVSYTYTATGAVDQVNYRGGTGLDYGYDIRDYVSSINNGATSGSYFAGSYTYKKNGNIATASFYNPHKNISDPGHKSFTTTYVYDGKNQLTGADYEAGVSGQSAWFDVDGITYDPNGNIKSLRRKAQSSSYIDNLSYNYSTSNRLNSLADAVAINTKSWDAEDATYGYDANGNMTSQTGKISAMHYNERNLPVHTVMSGGAEIIANYNAGGYRILKEVVGGVWEYHVRDEDRTLAVIRDDVLVYFNLFGNDMFGQIETSGGVLSLGSGQRYYMKDHLGSIRQVVNASGGNLTTTDYYPFGLVMPDGNTNNSAPNDAYKFTGHERDDEAELNLDYMLARNYDPAIGRFLQIDPMADQFPGWTPYHYVHNNPLIMIDPTGMASVDLQDLYNNAPNGKSSYTINEKGGFKRTDSGACDPPEKCEISAGISATALSTSVLAYGSDSIDENYSTSLYNQGYRKGIKGKYKLTGRNFSLFKNSPMTLKTRPVTAYGTLGKGLSRTATGLTALSTLYDTQLMIEGKLSKKRWSYRTSVTGLSGVAVYGLSGPYGVGVGVLGFVGEKIYDGLQIFRHYASIEIGNVESALKQGWVPHSFFGIRR